MVVVEVIKMRERIEELEGENARLRKELATLEAQWNRLSSQADQLEHIAREALGLSQ